MRLVFVVLALLISSAGFNTVWAADKLICTASDQRQALFFDGEVAGQHLFTQKVSENWTLKLLPNKFGWDLRIHDKQGLDLSQVTPPFHGVPNPREIYGWHFRNANNTGQNDGNVNAPQHLRLFQFSSSLNSTGGFKPSYHPDQVRHSSTDQFEGHGWFKILDMGLSDLQPNQYARMNYLRFSVCLNWPKTSEKLKQPLILYRQKTIDKMQQCGLNTKQYLIKPQLMPHVLKGDFDGDGNNDIALTLVRRSDNKRGLAICSTDAQLVILGMSGQMGEHLSAAYFDHIDWWALHQKGPVGQGIEENIPPTLFGDAIIIGKEGASSALIYWNGEQFTGYWQGD